MFERARLVPGGNGGGGGKAPRVDWRLGASFWGLDLMIGDCAVGIVGYTTYCELDLMSDGENANCGDVAVAGEDVDSVVETDRCLQDDTGDDAVEAVTGDAVYEEDPVGDNVSTDAFGEGRLTATCGGIGGIGGSPEEK